MGMPRSVILIVLLVFVAQAHLQQAYSKELLANNSSEASQKSVGYFMDEFINKMVGKLFNRALKEVQIDRAMDSAVLGKPMTVPSARIGQSVGYSRHFNPSGYSRMVSNPIAYRMVQPLRNALSVAVAAESDAPVKPKKPRSAYIFYSSAVRPSLSAAEKKDVAKAAQKIGSMWQGLDAKGKAEYEKMAENDKGRYEKEMESWEAAGGVDEKAAKKKATAGMPKKPRSAYILFSSQMRPSLSDEEKSDVGKAAKVLGEMWKGLDAKGKAPYDKLAKDDKVRYEKEMEAWTAAGGVAPATEKKKKSADGPKKPRSAYILFTKEMRPTLSAADQKDVGKAAQKMGAMWKGLDAKGKAPYEKMAKDDKVRYEKELKAGAGA